MSHALLAAHDVITMAGDQIDAIKDFRRKAQEKEIAKMIAWRKRWFWLDNWDHLKAKSKLEIWYFSVYSEEQKALIALQWLATWTPDKANNGVAVVTITKDDMQLLQRKFT